MSDDSDIQRNPPVPDDVLELRRVTDILGRIADGFDKNSDERGALVDAALAYSVVFQRKSTLKAFAKLKTAYGGQLTQAIRERLKAQGIDADELESELASEIDAMPDDENG